MYCIVLPKKEILRAWCSDNQYCASSTMHINYLLKTNKTNRSYIEHRGGETIGWNKEINSSLIVSSLHTKIVHLLNNIIRAFGAASTNIVTCISHKCVGSILHVSCLLIFKVKVLLTILKKYVSIWDITSFMAYQIFLNCSHNVSSKYGLLSSKIKFIHTKLIIQFSGILWLRCF
jgi:hypothetical protein